MVVASTHLARNPEDFSATKLRARQAAQLLRRITSFTRENGVHDAAHVHDGGGGARRAIGENAKLPKRPRTPESLLEAPRNNLNAP